MTEATPGPIEIKEDEMGFLILGGIEEGPHQTHHVSGLRYNARQRVIATVHGNDDEGRANAEKIRHLWNLSLRWI